LPKSVRRTPETDAVIELPPGALHTQNDVALVRENTGLSGTRTSAAMKAINDLMERNGEEIRFKLKSWRLANGGSLRQPFFVRFVNREAMEIRSAQSKFKQGRNFFLWFDKWG
jgi:hypothetical protein